MFIVLVHYTTPLDEVEAHLEAHRRFLDIHYASGEFLCSGPRRPRTGGVILARVKGREALEAILDEDPFRKAGVAEFELIEFSATKTAPALAAFVD